MKIMISWQYCAERKGSQEVVGGTAGDVRLSSARGGVKLKAAITQTQSHVKFICQEDVEVLYYQDLS